MKRMNWLVVAVVSLGLWACGPTVCSGTNCACPPGQSCAFDACTATTSGCNLDCAADATCSGTCGPSCRVNCMGKQCTHTVGAGSNITCVSGTCNITCEGACSVAGSATLTCKGGTTQTAAGCG